MIDPLPIVDPTDDESAGKEPPSILGATDDKLRAWLRDRSQPAFRLSQLQRGLYADKINDFAEISTLPAALRETLANEFQLFAGKVIAHQVASDRTEKLLVRLPDGEQVECVLMRETSRRTICISTQVGCAMGCVFCASGMLGVRRDLTTAEILEQVLRLDRLLSPTEKINRLTNVVVMGIGEPLANLGNLLPALDRITASEGLGLSPRRITISTVGLPKQMDRLAELNTPYNLAVSLHAPNDELRTKLVPVNRGTGINAILDAADRYFDRTGRRVSYEYVLLGEVNDHPHLAKQLVGLLRKRVAHVNLIPMNDVTELPFRSPAAPRTEEFLSILEAGGVTATVRKRKGADIDAACGQLRLVHEQQA